MIEVEETHQVALTEYQDSTKSLRTDAPNDYADDLWIGTNTLPDQEMQAVLSRSYQLGVYTWTTSAMGTDIITNMDVLETLLAIPNIAEKVAYFKYFRCKGVTLTIRVNSTTFHYGTLVASSTVNNSFEFHNSSNAAGFQWLNNRPVLIDAMSMEAVDYDIKWKHYAFWYDVQEGTPDQLMTFRLTVGVPLSMIGTAVNDARITVFANFIEPEVAFPVADSITAEVQGLNFDPDESSEEESTEEEATPVDPEVKRRWLDQWDEMLKSMSEHFGPIWWFEDAEEQSLQESDDSEARKKAESGSILSDVQSTANAVFSTVSTITDAMEKLAPLAALLADKPTSLETPKHMSILPGTDMPGFHGVDNAVRLQGDPGSTLGLSKGTLGESLSNPSIYECVRTPGFYSTWDFTNSTAAGTKLTEIPLRPNCIAYKSANTFTISPLSWYSKLFLFWRGSMKLHFHFATSTWVTARLRFVWIPPDHNAPVTIADNESGDYVSQVVEITGSMDHSLTIPWIHNSMYKEVADPTKTFSETLEDTNNAERFSLGTLAIYLVTPIVTASSTVVPRTTVLTWVSAGEDFQFSNFAGSLSSVPTDIWEFGSVSEQCSIVDAFAQPFEPIIKSTHAVEAGVATSEMYLDIATLGKRYARSSLFPEAASSQIYSTNARWNSFLLYPGVGKPVFFHQWLTACFVNFRGSMRFKFFWKELYSTDELPLVWGSYQTPPTGGTHSLTSAPVFTSSPKGNNFIEFETPFNYIRPFATRFATFTQGLDPFLNLPVTNASDQVIVGARCISFGDDFAVGVFQAPPLFTATTAPPFLESSPSDTPVHRNT